MRYLTLLMLIISGTVYPGSKNPAQTPAALCLQRADHHFINNKFGDALDLYTQAAAQFKDQSSWKGYVKAMAGKGYSLIRLRKYEDARATLDTALSTGKKSLGHSEEVATVYYVYGVLRDYTNKPTEALAMHEEALRMRRTLLGTNHFKVAESYNGIGEVYRYTLRNYIEAGKNFKASLDILEQLPNVDRKYLYRAYYNLATTSRLKSDYEKALGYGFRAIATLESIDPPDTISFIRCYGIIANIYNSQNTAEKAITYYRKALVLRLARKERSPEMANDYKNLAHAYILKNNFSTALHCVDSALMILLKSASYDSTEVASIYLIKGKALRESGRHQEAIENYKRSMEIQRHYSRSNALDIADICWHLSETMKQMRQYDSALYYIQQSIANDTGIKTLDGVSNPPLEVLEQRPQLYYELAHKGTILMKIAEGDNSIPAYRRALDCFKLSDKLMDRYWSSQDRQNSRLNFIGNNYYIYEQALNCIHKLYALTKDEEYNEVAFQLMDKSKARLLRQGLEELRERTRKNIPDSLLEQEQVIRSRIAALQNQLGSLKKDEASDSVEKALNTEMMVSEKELELWKTKVHVRFPQYTFEPRPPAAINLKELRGKLGSDVLFVEYFFGGELIYALGSLNGHQQLVRIPATGIQDSVFRFCRLLSKGLQSKSLEADFDAYNDLASGLYTDLLAPVFKSFDLDIKNSNRQIVIIPDGVLSLLPFQALTVSRLTDVPTVDYSALDYLVRHCTVSYSYDANSLFADSHTGSWGKGLLAFGWSDGIGRKIKSNDLPGTHRELQSIADIMSGEFLMGKDASKSSFITQAPAYSILHLAIHGEADDHDIYNNYLKFPDDKLFAHELYGLHLNANLTVLSACETGYGKVFDAEGVYSLARGFFHAGSRSLLMTLWRIDDQSTASLMHEFYRKIGDGQHLNNAIHQSQLAYLDQADQYAAHPGYWAGIVLWGAYGDVEDRTIFSTLYVGIPLLILLIALGRFIMHRKRKRYAETLESTAH